MSEFLITTEGVVLKLTQKEYAHGKIYGSCDGCYFYTPKETRCPAQVSAKPRDDRCFTDQRYKYNVWVEVKDE